MSLGCEPEWFIVVQDARLYREAKTSRRRYGRRGHFGAGVTPVSHNDMWTREGWLEPLQQISFAPNIGGLEPTPCPLLTWSPLYGAAYLGAKLHG